MPYIYHYIVKNEVASRCLSVSKIFESTQQILMRGFLNIVIKNEGSYALYCTRVTLEPVASYLYKYSVFYVYLFGMASDNKLPVRKN